MMEISLRGKDTCESDTPVLFRENSFAFREVFQKSLLSMQALPTPVTQYCNKTCPIIPSLLALTKNAS